MKAYLIDFENVKSKGLTGIEQLTADDKVIIFYSENSDSLNFEMHRNIMNSSADIEELKVRVGGKNALDFQLSTLLGYLLAKELYTHIFIISGDKGFDKLHDFWNVSFADRNSVTVFRTPTLSGAVSFAKDPKNRQVISEPEAPEVPAVEAAEPAAEEPAVQEAPAAEAPAPAEPEKGSTLPEEVKVTKSSRRRGRKPQSAAELIHNALLGILDISDKEAGDILACAAESEDKEDFHNRLAKIFKGHATEIYKVLRPKYQSIKKAIEDGKAPAEKEPAPEKATVPAAETKAGPVKQEAPVQQTAAEPVKTGSEKAEPAKKSRLNDSELFDQFLKECEEASKRSDAYEYEPQEQLVPEEIPETLPEVKEEPVKAEPAKAEKSAKPRKTRTRKKPAKAGTSKLAEELARLLEGQCTPEEIDTVTRLFEETDTKQKLYLGIVKKYRKDRGCEIYKLIKSEYTALASFKEI